MPIGRFYSFAARNLQKDRKLKPYPLNKIHISKLDLTLAWYIFVLLEAKIQTS
jgi:hypothetical protein